MSDQPSGGQSSDTQTDPADSHNQPDQTSTETDDQGGDAPEDASQPESSNSTNDSAGTGEQNSDDSATETADPASEPEAAADTQVPAAPNVSAQSGDASAQAGESQTGQINIQVSAGITGGGSGSVTVENEASTTIERTGSAEAKSGMAVALTPSPEPNGTNAGVALSGQTSASSGDATAIGIQSQSIVNNVTSAGVLVEGTNSGDIQIESVNQVEIVEVGTAVAISGDSLAANGPPIPIGTPGPSQATAGTVAGATSDPVSTVGLQIQNNETVSIETTATPVPDATGTLTVQHTGNVTIENYAEGLAASDGACTGSNCPPTPTKIEPLPDSTPTVSPESSSPPVSDVFNASSGSADATGLVAQNVVNTSADVNVKIGGENHGLIQVVIESITEIFNFGWASALTGNATASNDGAASSGSDASSTTTVASSGDVQATGAEIDNNVDLSSSASVKVEGDNYNPINIFINLFARITNVAVGMATSGNAEATADDNSDDPSSGVWAATSGSADAVGLDVQNQVNMAAQAAVDIEGSNYADIIIHVRFHTIIENIGAAFASSGLAKVFGGSGEADAVGGESAPPSNEDGDSGTGSSESDGSGEPNDSGSMAESSIARGGDATAFGHTSSVQIASAQHAVSNSDGEMNVVLPPVSNSLLELQPIPEEEDNALPEEILQLLDRVADIRAQSGDATSRGFTTGDAVMNIQVGYAANPGSENASVTNSFEFNMTAAGDSSAEAGFAGVNATPTPIPTPKPGTPGSEGSSDGESTYHQLSTRFQMVQTSGLYGYQPFKSNIKVSLPSNWPEFDQLQMPWQKTLVDESRLSAGARAWGGPLLFSDEAREIFKSFVNIDPMGLWPDLALPLMPDQTIAPNAEGEIAGPIFGPPQSSSKGPWNSLLWSVTGMLILGVMATRRGRIWMSTWTHACLRQAQAAARLMLGLMLH
ncbi:MAG: hypothetical protein ACOX87_12985 [Chloroflexota bacterium]